MRSAGFYLLQKGHKFAHKVAEDPSRQRVEGGSEGDATNQEDDVSSGQVCCRENNQHTEDALMLTFYMAGAVRYGTLGFI